VTRTRESGVVLIVDDDDDIREVMGDILSLRGHAVVGVPNGRKALEWLEGGGHACLILLDLMMPVMNGWEFRRRQLQSADLASVPVVVLT
jgi:CheY-like chemotaxis protein